MPTYAFLPTREEQRRGDQLNFAVAVGARASAARVAAETLLGEPNALAGWSSVDLTASPPPLSSSVVCRSARRRRPLGRRSAAAAIRCGGPDHGEP